MKEQHVVSGKGYVEYWYGERKKLDEELETVFSYIAPVWRDGTRSWLFKHDGETCYIKGFPHREDGVAMENLFQNNTWYRKTWYLNGIMYEFIA